MAKLQLQEGAAYYRITWADSAFTLPGVQPFIYVGTNLEADDTSGRTVRYFQDTLSHSWCGSLSRPETMREVDDIEPYVVTCGDEDLDETFVSLDGVIEQLLEARGRANLTRN